MKFLKSIIAASVLATSLLASENSYANDITVDMLGASSGIGAFIGTATLLNGGDDLVNYVNLVPGNYDFVFSMSSVALNLTSVLVNGSEAIASLSGFSGNANTPFVVQIFGTINSNSTFNPGFSGQLAFTAPSTNVPEAGTYLLLLAGLGIVGLAVRYRMFA